MAPGLSLPRITPLSPPATEVAGSPSPSLPPPGTDRPDQHLNDQIDIGRDDRLKPLTPEQKEALKAIFNNLSDSRTALIPELNNPGARKEIIDSLLGEVMNPYQINQGNKCTCAATEVLRSLAEKDPVAYATIVSGLVTKGAATLPNGDQITFVADSLTSDAHGNRIELPIGGSVAARSITERISQAAAMNYAMGGGNSYSNITDKEIKADASGLLDDQLRRLTRACFSADNLDYCAGTGSTLEKRRIDIVDRCSDRAKEGQQTLVSMFWGNSENQEHSVHYVSVLGVVTVGGQEYVKIHNPMCVTSDPNGTIFNPPPREINDHTRGIELMRRDEFEGRVRFAMIESTNSQGQLAAINPADNRVTGAALRTSGSYGAITTNPGNVVTGEIRHDVNIINGINRVTKLPETSAEQQPKQKKPRYDDEDQLVAVRQVRGQSQARREPQATQKPDNDNTLNRRKGFLVEEPIS